MVLDYNGKQSLPGGSGGGGLGPGSRSGGTGNTPPVSPPQGNNGGTWFCKLLMLRWRWRCGAAGGNAGPPSTVYGVGGVGSVYSRSFYRSNSTSYGTPGPVVQQDILQVVVVEVQMFLNQERNENCWWRRSSSTRINPLNAGQANTGGGAGGRIKAGMQVVQE